MDRYRKEVLQVSTRKHDINVQYLYDIQMAHYVINEIEPNTNEPFTNSLIFFWGGGPLF